jgi:SWIB/MDM2 domain
MSKNVKPVKKNVNSKTNKKVYNKKTTDKKKSPNSIDAVVTDNFETKLEELQKALKENYAQQKQIMANIKELGIMHKKEIKLVAKSGNRKNSGKCTGFNKPENVPDSLRNLLKIKEEMLPRSTVTKLMYQYFTDNKMYNPKTKKEIIPNAHIREIFGMKPGEHINFHNFQTWLKKVYQSDAANNNILTIED